MSGKGKAEVRADLTLDDHATNVLERIKGGFDHVKDKAKEVAGDIGGFFKNSLSTAFGFQLNGMFDTFKEFAATAIEEAVNPAKEIKAIQGVLTLTDQTGRSFEQLNDQALDFDDKLERLGVLAGSSGGDLITAFTEISEHSKKSSEGVLDMVEDLAYAAKAFPGGVGELTSGLTMFEAGMIRARNPIVQMIAATGMMKGNAKEVAKHLQEMGQEKAMKVAEAAIERMSKKMKDVPLDFGQTVQAFKDMRGDVFESLGAPFLRALLPAMDRFRRYWYDNKVELETMVASVGEKVGDWVLEATEQIENGFKYLQNHGEEIKTAITDGWNTAKKVVQWIIDHKTELAFALGGRMALGAAPSIATGASAAFGAAKFLGSAELPIDAMKAGMVGLGTKMKETAQMTGAVITGKAKLIGTLKETTAASFAAATGFAAAAAAAGAVYLAMDQWDKLMVKMENEHQTRMNNIQTLANLAKKGNDEFLENTIKTELALGHIDEKYAATLRSMADTSDMQFERIKAQADRGFTGAAAGIIDPIDDMVEAYNEATNTGNEKARWYAANILLNSGYGAEALIGAGVKLSGGLKGFEELFTGSADEVMEKLKKFVGDAYDPSKGKAAAPQVNFNGPNNFNIQQNFRDGDPSRVALVFQKDIIHAADARRQSRMATPFGF